MVTANGVLVGVISRGPAACGTAGDLAVDTNISSYISWIQSQITGTIQTGSYRNSGVSIGSCPSGTGTGKNTGGPNSAAVPTSTPSLPFVVVSLVLVVISVLFL